MLLLLLLDNGGAFDEGLSRSKFASELVTRSDGDGGSTLNNNSLDNNEGLLLSTFASVLITRSDDGDLILLAARSDTRNKLNGNDFNFLSAVRCDKTLYDNNFNSEGGENTLGKYNEGLSRSKFVSELVTRFDDDGGDIIVLDDDGLSRSKLRSLSLMLVDVIAFGTTDGKILD